MGALRSQIRRWTKSGRRWRMERPLRSGLEQSGYDNCSVEVIESIGGPGRDRTDDLFHAMEARSQLRHRPTMGTLRALRCGRALSILADLAQIVNASRFLPYSYLVLAASGFGF